MGDSFLRHLISLLATTAISVVYWAAYISGRQGWWWTFVGIIVIYVIIYKLVDA